MFTFIKHKKIYLVRCTTNIKINNNKNKPCEITQITPYRQKLIILKYVKKISAVDSPSVHSHTYIYKYKHKTNIFPKK